MLNLFTVFAAPGDPIPPDTNYGKVQVGFHIPDITQILTFILRFFFIIAGLVALLYLLLGALSWITSGGNKENVEKAREKIQAAVVGIVLIFVVLAVVIVIENAFGMSLGISKEISFPSLIVPGSN